MLEGVLSSLCLSFVFVFFFLENECLVKEMVQCEHVCPRGEVGNPAEVIKGKSTITRASQGKGLRSLCVRDEEFSSETLTAFEEGSTSTAL